MSDTILHANLPAFTLTSRGKVRDIFDLGDNLLFVATDRISAFDVVLPNGIPDKGVVLTQLSAFWFAQTAHIVPNHVLAAVPARFPAQLRDTAAQLGGRAMLVRKAKRIDVECVVRGYLAGSAWTEYTQSGTVAGEKVPPGLRESDRLPQLLFTPSTKAESGHDENISRSEMAAAVGASLASKLEQIALAVYRHAEEVARRRGIIIADTKMEFGLLGDEIILIDELLTPDSSRFWPTSEYLPGQPQASFDKQFVRDWLIASGWNKEPPAPVLPADVVAKTADKYREAYGRLVGRPFDQWAEA